MFLNIRKIGKAKHKFKAKLTFITLTNEATEKGKRFKVKIERGSHEIEAVSEPIRKGTAKFQNIQYTIPMTLFGDQDEKEVKYLQKEGIVKAYESDEKGNEIRKIGEKKIDLSEFAKGGMLTLEIQLDPEKRVDSPILILQIFLERQDDDSKSVQTYSSNNDKRNQEDIQNDKKEKSKKKEEPKRNDVSPSPKDVFSKGKQQKKPQNSQMEAIEEKKQVRQRRYEQERRKISVDKQEQVLGQKPKIPKVPEDSGQRKDKINEKEKAKQGLQNQQSESRSIGAIIENKGSPLENGQSPQLQNFILKRTLRQKETQVANFKRQNEILKKTIEKMIQESSTVKQAQKRAGYGKQVDEMKKALISKDIEIDKLTTTNKTLSSREEQYQKTIIKLRQELFMSKEKISDMKYRQAYLMQQLFQTANKEALEEACRFLGI